MDNKMLANYHTHTSYCDGENTPEEIVLYAIEKGFTSIGFSGHGHTPFDLRYCMKDMPSYIKEISELKKKYGDKIEIYCGIEEDAFSPVERENFDYIIGSSHYFNIDGKYYPIDSGYDYFKKCLAAFDNDELKLAEVYYSTFVSYITERKPDIVGHFDLITKYDEVDVTRFLNSPEYFKIAKKYLQKAAENDVIFEVNTGAISKGIRKTPYLGEELLYILKENGGKVMLSSDSHSIETLDFHFEEAAKLLRDVGFDHVYELHQGTFKKRLI